MAVFQRRFLYFPDRRLTHPAEAGLSGVEELRLVTDDGETLVAWYLPPRHGHPPILYFHGHGGALIDRVPRFRMFAASGYGFLGNFLSRLWRLDWLADTNGFDAR